MHCVFEDGKCVRCGVKRNPPYPVRECNPPLGDRIASGLSAVGITKTRAMTVARAFGLHDCGCQQRQQLANELGYLLGIGEKPAFADGDKPAE